MKVLERFSLPKRGQGEANGDALYVGQDYVAVIDGATPSSRPSRGRTRAAMTGCGGRRGPRPATCRTTTGRT